MTDALALEALVVLEGAVVLLFLDAPVDLLTELSVDVRVRALAASTSVTVNQPQPSHTSQYKSIYRRH